MLKVLDPTTIKSSMLTVTNAPESTAGEWASGATYAVGNFVKRTTNHRIYKRLTAGSGATVPESDAVNWVDVGPTNDWAMFDGNVSTRTVGAEAGLYFSLQPGRCNGIALLDVVKAKIITVSCVYSYESNSDIEKDTTSDYAYGITLRTVISGSKVNGSNPAKYIILVQLIYSITLEYRNVSDWKSYFYEPYSLKSDVFLAFSSRNNYTISVAINEASPEIGSFVVGNFVEIGDVGYGVTAGIEDYSLVKTDEFGVSKLTERDYVKRVTYPVTVRDIHINRAFSTLAAVRAKPTVFIGSDDYRLSPLTVFGRVSNFEMSLSFPTHSIFNVEIQGLKL